jgi:hypothetical protein
VADLQTKLRWLSERGDPVGAEELIERIEGELAGDPLVVVTKRREGTTMTKTQQPPTTKQRSRNLGAAWGVAAFVVILAAAGLYLALSGDSDQGEVADIPPPPATVPPDVETMTDLEVVEAGVAAFYSGDGERAAELFELAERRDDEIREEAAYQAAIDGRLQLNCSEQPSPGTFSCRVPYHNALTDAIGHVDSGDIIRVVVEDGVITEFGFPEHSWIVIQMGTFLAMEGRFDSYGDCAPFGPFPESCATIQLENLDSWLEWRQTLEPVGLVEFGLESWYGGDCEEARFASSFVTNVCSTPDTATQTIGYESILGADVSVEGCEEVAETSADQVRLSCEVHYSNAMSTAVGKPPSATVREFNVYPEYGLMHLPEDPGPWYLVDYPEDTELRESFRLFAEGSELADEYAAARCANTRSPECANVILDNLGEWATWYETNS